MDSAVGAKTEEMEFATVLLYIVVGGMDLGVLQETVLAAGDVDLHKVLIHNASGAEVHVSHLAVAHLAVRQTDVLAAGVQMRHGIFGPEAVDEGSPLGINCIAMVVASLAPTVKNH